jgi:N-acetylglucosamine-6-phosphate deacetylase
MEVPGLLDLQVNGYKGVDFSSPDLTQEDFVGACRGIFDAGTTAFLPTIITSPMEVYEHNLPIVAAVLESEEFRGRLLGVHLEGPFISAAQGARGAHNPEWIVRPDIQYLNKMVTWAEQKVKMITIAADAEGVEDVTRWCVRRQIVVSLGHHMAGESDLERLRLAGARALTHFGNGVPTSLPRHENPIWAGLSNDGLRAMIVTDGHHLPPSVLKTFIRAKGVCRCMVVSDMSPIAGMSAGHYNIFGNKVILEKSGRIYNPDTGYLAGSSATMLQCMNYLASLGLLSIEQLVQMCFFNPLRLLEVDPSSIQPGKAIVYDEQNNVFRLR